MKDLNQILNQLKVELQLEQIEIGPLGTPLTISFYEKWLSLDYHADMAYLKNHFEIKKNPQELRADLRSVITVTQPYFPAVIPHDITPAARVATYAQNKDYHFWLKDKMQTLITALKAQYPQEEFLPFVDSGPVLERNWAFENGLGWFGKNTCLIHPKYGSLFFIAEILSTLPTEDLHEAVPDFCGKCQKCMEICPTQALIEPHVMKAERCISYLTIESKQAPPLELREKMGDWFFGCDLCQTVCPWNEKVFRQKQIPPQPATSTKLQLELSSEQKKDLIDFFRFLLKSSNKQIEKHFYGSPLSRAGGNGLKRNALVVIANRKITELTDDVSSLKDHPKWSELSQWCLDQLSHS